MIIFEFDSFKPSIFKTAKLNFIVLFLFVTCNVDSNFRMATCYIDSIFKAKCGVLMTSLKLTTMSIKIHCRIFISDNILFLYINLD